MRNQIQVFQLSTRRFLRSIGRQGIGDGGLTHPSALAVDPSNDSIYVADTNNNRVQAFRASDGTFLRKFGTKGLQEGQMLGPNSLHLDAPTATLLVGNRLLGRVCFYRASDGAFLHGIGAHKGLRPPKENLVRSVGGIALDGESDLLIVSDILQHQIHLFRASTGESIRKFGTPGEADTDFNGPSGLAFDRETRCLFIAEQGNARINIFRVTEDTSTHVGIVGAQQLRRPVDVALHPVTGDLIVPDCGFQQVFVFSFPF